MEKYEKHLNWLLHLNIAVVITS